MTLRPPDPKSGASASSATFAGQFETASEPRIAMPGQSSQKAGEFFDSRAACQARRWISTGAYFVVECEFVAAGNYMQTPMCVALGGQQPVSRAEILLKYRNAEGPPKRVAIGVRNSWSACIGEDHHRVLKRPTLTRQRTQPLERSGNGSRIEALHSLIPALRENAHHSGRTKARR